MENSKDLELRLPREDMQRLLEVAVLINSEQDKRILDRLRYALANGDR